MFIQGPTFIILAKFFQYCFRKGFNPLWPAGKTVAKMHFRSILLTFLSWFLSAEIVYSPLMYIYKFENESILVSISTHFWEAMIIILNLLWAKKSLLSYFLFHFQPKQIPYARHHKPLLIRSRTWIQAIHKDRIFWKNLLKNKEMVFGNGGKIYKPRLIMARVRYTFNVLVDHHDPPQPWTLYCSHYIWVKFGTKKYPKWPLV